MPFSFSFFRCFSMWPFYTQEKELTQFYRASSKSRNRVRSSRLFFSTLPSRGVEGASHQSSLPHEFSALICNILCRADSLFFAWIARSSMVLVTGFTVGVTKTTVCTFAEVSDFHRPQAFIARSVRKSAQVFPDSSKLF